MDKLGHLCVAIFAVGNGHNNEITYLIITFGTATFLPEILHAPWLIHVNNGLNVMHVNTQTQYVGGHDGGIIGLDNLTKYVSLVINALIMRWAI